MRPPQVGQHKTSTANVRARSSRARRQALDVIVGGDRAGIDPARVAECVVRVVKARSPKLRYRVGPDASWLPRLKLLPWSWYEKGIRWRYRLP
jgi:hypothetical protein